MTTTPRPGAPSSIDPATLDSTPPASTPPATGPTRFAEGDGYVPGACNIGPAEIARRRRSGWLGLGAAAVLAVVLVAVTAPPVLRLSLFVPFLVAAIGFVQARARFCVGFAGAGISNFGELGATVRVDDAAARATDRQRARILILRAGAVAVLGAVVAAVLPI
jgi:hypothetical protein